MGERGEGMNTNLLDEINTNLKAQGLTWDDVRSALIEVIVWCGVLIIFTEMMKKVFGRSFTRFEKNVGTGE